MTTDQIHDFIDFFFSVDLWLSVYDENCFFDSDIFLLDVSISYDFY